MLDLVKGAVRPSRSTSWEALFDPHPRPLESAARVVPAPEGASACVLESEPSFTLPETPMRPQGVSSSVRGIDRDLVDHVWRDVTAYPPARVASEAAEFIARQPHVAVLTRAMTEGQDPAVGQAAFGLAFLLVKIVEESLGHAFPPIAEARIAEACEATRQWLAGDAAADPAGMLERAADPAHPSLVPYVLSVFYGEADGVPRSEYDEGVRACLALLLRTLSTALDLGAVE